MYWTEQTWSLKWRTLTNPANRTSKVKIPASKNKARASSASRNSRKNVDASRETTTECSPSTIIADAGGRVKPPSILGARAMATPPPEKPDKVDPQSPPEAPPRRDEPQPSSPDEIVPPPPDIDVPDRGPGEVPSPAVDEGARQW